MEDIRIVRNETEQRYELFLDDELAAFTEFASSDDAVIFPHTVTVDEFRGRGLAGKVVRFALDDIRARGERIVARCPYVARFIDEHPEYSDLLA
jgi:hypothetical protein